MYTTTGYNYTYMYSVQHWKTGMGLGTRLLLDIRIYIRPICVYRAWLKCASKSTATIFRITKLITQFTEVHIIREALLLEYSRALITKNWVIYSAAEELEKPPETYSVALHPYNWGLHEKINLKTTWSTKRKTTGYCSYTVCTAQSCQLSTRYTLRLVGSLRTATEWKKVTHASPYTTEHNTVQPFFLGGDNFFTISP